MKPPQIELFSTMLDENGNTKPLGIKKVVNKNIITRPIAIQFNKISSTIFQIITFLLIQLYQ